jgi:hypothetical protein
MKRLLLNICALLLLGGTMHSCTSQKDVVPEIKSQLTEKWWCDSKGNLADQFFGTNGQFQQRYKNSLEIGKWKLAEDRKTIVVSEVGENLLGSWSYTLRQVTDDRLEIDFYGGVNVFNKCP